MFTVWAWFFTNCSPGLNHINSKTHRPKNYHGRYATWNQPNQVKRLAAKSKEPRGKRKTTGGRCTECQLQLIVTEPRAVATGLLSHRISTSLRPVATARGSVTTKAQLK